MSLEAENKQRVRMTKLRGAILTTIEIAGVVTLATMAPKVVSLLGPIQKRRQEKLLSALTRLKKKGLIRFDGNTARLTPSGQAFLAGHTFRVARPWRWDKKWRVVIFDVPESRKEDRKRLRIMLQRIGFYRLQHSVWAFPYDCEELITLLKTEQQLRREALYMIVDKIERDGDLRKHFDLT